METIGEYAFWGCSALDGNISLPDSLKNIELGGFRDCTNLTGPLVLPEGLQTLGMIAFENCKNLSGTLVIPAGITTIEERTFYYCQNIEEVIFQEGLLDIGINAFNHCEKLSKNVIIPKSVTDVRKGAFYNTSLRIVFLGTATNCVSSGVDNRVVYYPEWEPSWTEDFRNNNGPKATWVPYEKGDDPWNRKHGWDKSEGDWKFYDHYGYPVINAWAKSGNSWFYLGQDGFILKDKLLYYEGDYYYLGSNGAMRSNSFQRVKEKPDPSGYFGTYTEYYSFYFGDDGKAVKNTFISVLDDTTTPQINNVPVPDSKNYYANEYGLIIIGGKINIGGKEYYASLPDGLISESDPVEIFIHRLYTTCLSREADSDGLNYWKGCINKS